MKSSADCRWQCTKCGASCDRPLDPRVGDINIGVNEYARVCTVHYSNPWAGQQPCPQCRSDRWTMPFGGISAPSCLSMPPCSG